MIIRRPIHINITSALLLIVLNGVHYSNMGLWLFETWWLIEMTTTIALFSSYKSYGSFIKNRKPKKHNKRRFHKQTKIGKSSHHTVLLQTK